MLSLVVVFVVAPWLFLVHAHEYGAHIAFGLIATRRASKTTLNPKP
jgi:hypothetical protein